MSLDGISMSVGVLTIPSQNILIGMAGIEPTTCCSQNKRSTSEPHPDIPGFNDRMRNQEKRSRDIDYTPYPVGVVVY